MRDVSPAPVGARSTRWRTMLALALVALAIALPLRELFQHQSSPMEEGFMLVFPSLVLDGEIANRDFLHLYGPGSLWVLAGAYELFGTSLATERVVGLLQHLGLIGSVFALALPWGRRIATTGALVTAVVILFPVGLAAMAWNGGLALALAGLAVGLPALRPGTDVGPARRRLAAAGLLAGLALLYRPDLIVAVGLGFGALAWSVGRARLRPLLVGLGAGLAPYLVHLATAGVGNAVEGMLLDPVFELRDGRTLPVPPSTDRLDGALQKAGTFIDAPWPFPELGLSHQVFAWFWLLVVAVAFIAVIAVIRARQDRSSYRNRVLLCVGLLALGLLPQALQRPDSTHLAWVSAVPLGFLPVAFHEALARPLRGLATGTRAVVAGGAVLAGVLLLIPSFTGGAYADHVRQSLFREGIERQSINVGDRNFWLGRGRFGPELQSALGDLQRLSEPGDSLIVGPGDLRFTPYSDAYVYFLLPELEVGTYYVEMDPGVANADDSGLADELREADFYLASRLWEAWDEPNASQDAGSDEPNRVLDQEYCQVDDYGQFIALYQRCP